MDDGIGTWAKIAPPVVIVPNGGLLNALLGITLSVTPMISSSDTWASTIYEVRTGANGTGTLLYAGAGIIPALTLGLGQTLYIRAKYTGSSGFVSDYSADVVVTT